MVSKQLLRSGRSVRENIFHLPFLMFLILIVFLLTSCNNTTKPKTGSLSGHVILVNDTDDPSYDLVDFSGVTVALYELAELDTTILRINREYPHIGVQISQETEFDHRLQDALIVVKTNVEGEFKFNSVPFGTYNIVAFKEGWGVRYYYNQKVVQSVNRYDFESKTCMNMELYPVTELSHVSFDTIIFESNHCYLVSLDSIVFSEAVAHGQSTLLIDPDVKIDFHGGFTCVPSEGFRRFTSSHGIYESDKIEHMSRFQHVLMNSDDKVKIENLIVEYSNNGLRSTSNDVSISNSIFRDNTGSALSLNCSHANVLNSIISNNENKGIVANGHLKLINSILYSNDDACFLSDTNCEVIDNYVVGNYMGVRPFYGEVKIRHNNFDMNENAISSCASNPEISKNAFFENNRDIELNGYYTHFAFDYCNPDVFANNFFGNRFYIHLKGRNSVYAGISISGVNEDQHYPNNYFKKSDLTQHIYDSSYPGSSTTYKVYTNPRRSNAVLDAGIQ